MKRVLVGIVSYNGQDYLRKCLTSLKSKKNKLDIFIVDNASTDQTKDVLGELLPQTSLYFSSKNLGFGKANNIIFQKSIVDEYDYVLLLNQDTYIIGESIDLLLNGAETNHGFSIYSPIHLASDEEKLDPGFKRYKEQEKINGNSGLRFINAAAWLLPIAVIKKVGGFNPLFYHYGEDRDYAQRLQYWGGNYVLIENSFIVHDRTHREVKDYYKLDPQKYKNRSKINLLRYLTDVNINFTKAKKQIKNFSLKLLVKDLYRFRFAKGIMHIRNYEELKDEFLEIEKNRKKAQSEGAFLTK